MDLIKSGKQYGSDKAHSEAGRCLPLLVEHGAALQEQGIEPGYAARLEDHGRGLTTADQLLADAKQVQQKDTDTVRALLQDSVSLVGKAWSFASKRVDASLSTGIRRKRLRPASLPSPV